KLAFFRHITTPPKLWGDSHYLYWSVSEELRFIDFPENPEGMHLLAAYSVCITYNTVGEFPVADLPLVKGCQILKIQFIHLLKNRFPDIRLPAHPSGRQVIKQDRIVYHTLRGQLSF